MGVVTAAPGGNWNKDGTATTKVRDLEARRLRGDLRVTEHALRGGADGARPRHALGDQVYAVMSKPLSDMVEDVTLSLASPATSDTPLRNPTQCAGV